MIKNEDNTLDQLSPNEKAFVQEHIQEDVNHLLLKFGTTKAFDIKKLASQISARQKALKKLPEWYENFNLIFPPALSIEQASSEATAKFKAGILNGELLVDITGGTGIDHYYLSKNFKHTIYIEYIEKICRVAQYNFKILKAKHIQVLCDNSITFLKSATLQADWLYADPARRDSNNNKVVLLSECTPDLIENLALLYKTARNLMFKTSPLLDISKAVKELGGIFQVFIIGSGNECKELLFHLNKDKNVINYQRNVRILNTDGSVISALDYTTQEESEAIVTYSHPTDYLYEPHAAVLKAGFFNILCSKYKIDKLAPSSHLYTSKIMVTDFPGRLFKVVATCKPDRNELYKIIGTDKANISIRNFPSKVQDLRKKLGLKEGGDCYLFATTLADKKKVIVITEKVNIKHTFQNS